MNDLPPARVLPFPPRTQAFKSWAYIAGVFDARAERERKFAWERLATGDAVHFHRHITRAEALDEAAEFAREQEEAS